MAPLPIIANVYRCVILWDSSAGITPRNVFHVRCTSSSDVLEIGTAIDIAHATSGIQMFNALHEEYDASGLQITPLDGSTAAVDVPLDPVWSGLQSGEVIPAAAAVVSFHTAQRGSRGRGRLYIGPISEVTQNAGVLLSAHQTAMLSGWGGFLEDLLSGTPSVELGVASYVHADFHPVTSIRVDTLLGTMRRRQDQLR